MISVSDLDKYESDRDRFLWFLYELERMGLISSRMEIRGDRMERVWYAKSES